MKPIIAPYGSASRTHGPAQRIHGPARRTNGPAKRHALIAMAALAAALTGSLASATTVDDGANQKVVHYSDLDLSRPEDARRLYTRIRIAARTVCENFRSPDLQLAQIYKQCRDKAVADAVAKVQSAQLAAIADADIQHLAKR
jgi:UrcA family protein